MNQLANVFLFPPMLHEVAASDLEIGTIVNPLRKLVKKVRVAFDWTLDLCFAKDFACVTAGPHGSRDGTRVEAARV